MNAIERFLKYVAIDTQSDEESATYPSTQKQVEFLSMLATELEGLGVSVDFDGKYVIGSLERVDSNTTLAFIAHVDTSPAVSGANVKTVLTKYNGGDIVLENAVIEEKSLEGLLGQTIISSDGNTLLGADDKAGVAEIMSAVEKLAKTTNRCNVKIVFTPDEEVGRGTEQLDLNKVKADYGYTVDGGRLGEIEYENFNAASVKLTITGKNIHPGSAKNVMKNAIDMFCDFHSRLPQSERPNTTENYQGFYMVNTSGGDVECYRAHYIIRDHDKDNFEKRKQFVRDLANQMNEIYNGGFEVEITDSYYNMRSVIEKHFHLVENANKAFEQNGITPISRPIRGGTDGAMLSFKGLPCPNLSTGGVNFHARNEFVPSQSIEKMVDVIVTLARLYK